MTPYGVIGWERINEAGMPSIVWCLVPRLPQTFHRGSESEAAIKSLGRPGDEASVAVYVSVTVVSKTLHR